MGGHCGVPHLPARNKRPRVAECGVVDDGTAVIGVRTGHWRCSLKKKPDEAANAGYCVFSFKGLCLLVRFWSLRSIYVWEREPEVLLIDPAWF